MNRIKFSGVLRCKPIAESRPEKQMRKFGWSTLVLLPSPPVLISILRWLCRALQLQLISPSFSWFFFSHSFSFIQSSAGISKFGRLRKKDTGKKLEDAAVETSWLKQLRWGQYSEKNVNNNNSYLRGEELLLLGVLQIISQLVYFKKKTDMNI